MKKIILSLMVFYFAFCKISFGTVLIVNNNNYNGNFLTGHYSDPQIAVNNASVGDTLYFMHSNSSYGWFTANTRLVYMGDGYGSINGILPPRLQHVILNSGADSSTIQGLVIEYLFVENSLILHDCYMDIGSFEIKSNCHIYKNIFERISQTCILMQYTGAGTSSNNIIHNNIFNNGGISISNFGSGTGNQVYNNLFISIPGASQEAAFLQFNNALIENNIFYRITPQLLGNPNIQVTNCTFNNNLTFETNADTLPFGSNTGDSNLIANPQFGTFQDYSNPFDFSLDYRLQASSLGHNYGTDGTDIGPYGGSTSLTTFEGTPQIPQVTELDFNPIIGQGDSLVFHTSGYSNAGDSIIAAEYFFDADTVGSSFPITITVGNTFDFSHSLNHDSLALGTHVFGFRVMNSNNVWSFPEMRSFEVCAINGPLANFDYYVYGFDVILNNTSQNQDSCKWNFSDGTTSNQINLVHHFPSAGIKDVQLISFNSCDVDGDTLTKTISLKGISTISPNKGGNFGVVTVTLTGFIFNDSTTVKLVKAGQSDIVPLDSTTVVTEGVKILTVFDLKDAALGKWDVVVDVPGDTIYTVLEGFEVDSGIVPFFKTDLIGPTTIRDGTWTNYALSVENKGNVDAFLVPVWFAVPSEISIDLKFELEPPHDTLFIDYDTMPKFVIIDTLFGLIGNFKVYGFTIPFISGGSNSQLNFKLLSPNGGFKLFYAWVNEPLVFSDSSQLNRQQSTGSSNCVYNKQIDCALALANIPTNCYQSVFLSLTQLSKDALCYGIRNIPIASTVWNWTVTGLYCLGQINPLALILGYTAAIGTAMVACNPGPPGPGGPGGIDIITSLDPNNKYGPKSVYGSLSVQSSNFFNYVVNFENADSATASAQTVIITDTLDKNNLNLNTFEFRQISFGDTTIEIPSGRKSFTTDIDLQPNIPLIVRLEAYLNDSTGVATYSFVSLDPLTMEPTDSVFIGFLPQNDSTGKGEGNVIYSVRTKDSIATGTVINNKADIYFDNNAPVTTQTWTNIIDDLKPQSQVTSSTQIANTDSIIVNWSGSDNGPAGLYSYFVYYNINGGSWLLWKYNTSLTSDIFVGIVDSTYGFYSVATDSALNVEDKPITADDSTTVIVGIEEINQSQMIVKVFPNPATNSVTIYIKRFDKSKNDFNITARDITGRTIRNEKINLTADTKTIQLDISQFVSGIYFFEITDGTYRTFRKLIKE